MTNGLVDLMKELRKKFLEITVRSSIKEYLISIDISFCFAQVVYSVILVKSTHVEDDIYSSFLTCQYFKYVNPSRY